MNTPYLQKNKKAAMFGLDARIALAIFTALSIITGAILFKVIKNNKLLTEYQQIQEVIKATEAYYLDTSSMIALESVESASLLVKNLFNAAGPNWKGPYLQFNYKTRATISFPSKVLNKELDMQIDKRDTGNWPINIADEPLDCTESTTDCNEWINYTGTNAHAKPLENLFNSLDLKYDDGTGPFAGNLRLRKRNPINSSFYIKGINIRPSAYK